MTRSLHRTFSSLGFVAVLSACGGGSTDDSHATFAFTEANAYGSPMPASATTIGDDDFSRRVAAGDLTLLTATGASQGRDGIRKTFATDIAALRALNSADPAVASLVSLADSGQPPPERSVPVVIKNRDGTSRSVVLQPPGPLPGGWLGARTALADPARLLALYGEIYAGLGEGQRDGQATPADLTGAAASTLRGALSKLDGVLMATPDLDGIRDIAPVVTRTPKSLPQQRSVDIRFGPGSGNGTDSSGTCGDLSPFGIVARVTWPLKDFQTSVRDQGSRGTCWAFSAVAAMEERDRVVSGLTRNYSEQFAVNFDHGGPFAGFYGDEGGWPHELLNRFVDRDHPFAFETEWTYNPSRSRASGDSETGVCLGYTGLYGENSAQDPMVCTTRDGRSFCAIETTRYTGTSTSRASRAEALWAGGDLPLGVVRERLARGIPLLVSFFVTDGFMEASGGASHGWVTNLADSRGGGHASLIVGFVPDDRTTGWAPRIAGGTGGGWFVLKNSWGCGAGDAGYWYVPLRYAQRYFWLIHQVQIGDVRHSTWRDRVAADFRPRVSLVVEGGSRVVAGTAFTVRAVAEGGGAGCCSFAWSPDAMSTRGTTATYTFTGPGARTVSLTASNPIVGTGTTASATGTVVALSDRPPTGEISLAPEHTPAIYFRRTSGDSLLLQSVASDPEGSAVFSRWRATALSDAGVPTTVPLELGSGSLLPWDLGSVPLGAFLNPALCQRGAGQRVRIELVATDADGNFHSPFTAQREVSLACIVE